MVLDRDEKVLGEWPLLIEPLGLAAEAGAAGHFDDFARIVFVRAFGPNGLAFLEQDTQTGGGNLNTLAAL